MTRKQLNKDILKLFYQDRNFGTPTNVGGINVFLHRHKALRALYYSLYVGLYHHIQGLKMRFLPIVGFLRIVFMVLMLENLYIQ